MNALIDGICRLFNWTIALFLGLMVVLVFGNVVLRYGVNSGIAISEELSRWLFVWVTFLGSIVALREHGHLGTDMLLARLGATGKRVCLAISYSLMLALCGVLFKGTWEQVKINLSSTSAAMEVSMAWFFACGLVFAVLGGIIIAIDLVRVLSGRASASELSSSRESEDVPHGKH